MSDVSTNGHEPASAGSTHIESECFPSLYQSADQAAIQMQRICFCFRWWYLAFLILGSMVAVLRTIIPEPFSMWFQVGVAVVLVIGVLINIISRLRKYDESWFYCRSVAESTKTASWRFMMKSSPFEEDSTAEETFASKVSEIRRGRTSILSILAQYQNPDAPLITDFMKDIRQKSTDDRKIKYLNSRLLDQKNWYWQKSYSNSTIESRLFYITIVLQFLAIIIAIIQCTLSTWPVNLIPVLMTFATALIAWNQMKRHNELAQSYALIAQELEELETEVDSLTEESEFRKFVNDVEYAISREHTMWCIRREVVVNQNNQK